MMQWSNSEEMKFSLIQLGNPSCGKMRQNDNHHSGE